MAFAASMAVVGGCERSPEPIERVEVSPELGKAQAYLDDVLSEPDPKLRPLAETIRKNGGANRNDRESIVVKTETKFDENEAIVSWDLNHHPTESMPCRMSVEVPRGVSEINFGGFVLSAWNSLNPSPIIGPYFGPDTLLEQLDDKGVATDSHDGWSYCLSRDNREVEVRFYRGGLPASISKNALTQSQISNLFSKSWIANDEATRGYPLNANVEQLDDKAWLYCVQWKLEGYFKDAGLQLKDSVNGKLPIFEIDYEATDLEKQLRILDPGHFAFAMQDRTWVVFQSK